MLMAIRSFLGYIQSTERRWGSDNSRATKAEAEFSYDVGGWGSDYEMPNNLKSGVACFAHDRASPHWEEEGH